MTFTSMFEAKWKTVRCDHCGAEFAYRVEDHAGAVTCPCCGYFQSGVLSAVRSEAFSFFTVLAVLAMALGLIIAALSGDLPAALPFGAAGLVLMLIGRLKMARFDPNADAASRVGLQDAGVMLREDYELLRSLARRRAEPVAQLDWQGHVHRGTAAFAQ